MIKIYKYYPIIILEINTLNNLSFKDLTEYINFIINYLQNICPIKIELHYINKKKMWDNLFKE